MSTHRAERERTDELTDPLGLGRDLDPNLSRELWLVK